MLNLSETVSSAFHECYSALSLAPATFNPIWSDMATESTVINDGKDDGGVIGLTRKEPAFVHWFLTRHIMGTYSSEMQIHSGHSTSNIEHKQC